MVVVMQQNAMVVIVAAHQVSLSLLWGSEKGGHLLP
jgi:hypothetical protein